MPNWKKIITSGSDAAFNSVLATSGFTGSLSGTASYALTASYVVNTNSYTTNIAGGSSTETITHNLNSRDVHVTVYRNSSPWDAILCDTQRTTVNAVDLIFAYVPTAAQFRVVVSK
jgi:hypothetical protein